MCGKPSRFTKITGLLFEGTDPAKSVHGICVRQGAGQIANESLGREEDVDPALRA
jgi:hypothetical protein